MNALTLCAVTLLLAIGPSAAAGAPECATTAPPPLTPPAALAPPPASYDHPKFRDRLSWYEDGFWGVGFLQPSSEHPYDWLGWTLLPLYDAPGGEPVGWLNHGWLQRDGAAIPVSPYGLVETGYETESLILAHARDDGWLGLRLTDQPPDDGGVLWTHACRLVLGAVHFEIVLWRELFLLRDRVSTVLFRSPVAHALRAEPTADGELLAWIREDDDLEVLEIRGDWARVRAFQPGKYVTLCSGAGEWRGTSRVGWVRWWGEMKGTWLRYPTRGC